MSKRFGVEQQFKLPLLTEIEVVTITNQDGFKNFKNKQFLLMVRSTIKGTTIQLNYMLN